MDTTDRKARAEGLRGREVRRVAAPLLEIREAEDTFSVTGCASTTGQAYDMGFYQETISRGAFKRTLGENPDVQLLINHEGLPLARTANGSLSLSEEDAGLMFTADLSTADPDAARIASKVQAGLLNECSFAFRVINQEWDDDYENRDIKEVSLHRGDVSIVNFGANPNTSVALRGLLRDLLAGLTDEEAEDIKKNFSPDELRAAHEALAHLLPEPVVEPVVEEPEKRHDLDIYRARAYALSIRK